MTNGVCDTDPNLIWYWVRGNKERGSELSRKSYSECREKGKGKVNMVQSDSGGMIVDLVLPSGIK